MTRNFWLLGAILLFAGCSGGAKTLPTTPVTGKVTYKGTPVGGATVSFSPVKIGKDQLAATAVTDESGAYKAITSFGGSTEREGAVAGDYVVTIIKSKAAASTTTGAPNPADIAQQMGAKNKDRKPESSSRTGPMGRPAGGSTTVASLKQEDSEIPVRYGLATTSPLKATVPGGPFDFELTDK